MKSLTKALNRFILVSYDMIRNITGAITVAIIMIVSIGIVSRYTFSHAISWIGEICCLLLIRLCYLSASLTTVTKEHMVADLLSGSLPANMQKVLRGMTRIGKVISFGVVTYSVIRLLPKLTNVSTVLKLSRYWYHLPVLMFDAYMVLAIVVDMVNDFVPRYDYFGQRRGEKEKARMEQERKENLGVLKRIDAFMEIGNEEGKGEQI